MIVEYLRIEKNMYWLLPPVSNRELYIICLFLVCSTSDQYRYSTCKISALTSSHILAHLEHLITYK